ncbi:DUF1501 domain-containing protein [Alienimonas chondri]
MSLTRRSLLTSAAAASAAATLPRGLMRTARAEDAAAALPAGKAEHCIVLWLGGGACQIDTFDPKRVGDPKTRKQGSAYPAIPTAIPGVEFCEHLPMLADRADRLAVIRSTNHDVIDEHARAVNRMHTGRNTTGTVVYPSIGSVMASELGAAGDNVPAYMLIGMPSVSRGPGFLGPSANFVYLTDTSRGPSGLTVPGNLPAERRARRERLLGRIREDALGRTPEGADAIRAYDETIAEALRLAGPEFAQIFDASDEPADLRNAYGSEFGQRCLLARRLVQRGVRFVEVSHNIAFTNGTGWDTHNEGQAMQHLLIRELDVALAALTDDLAAQGLLDKTLVVVATEFGRPAGFDGGGGRGHHGKSFTSVLAGGGLNLGRAVGETDELGMSIVADPVSVPDLHATIYHAMGIDPHLELYAGERPVPVTDGGHAVRALFV